MITYKLAVRSSVTATVTDAAGAVVATLFSAQLQSARTQSFPYAAEGLGDGNYTLAVSAVADDGRTGSAHVPFTIDRTLSGLMLSTAALTPNGDGADDTLEVDFMLSAPADVTVQVEQNGLAVAAIYSGSLSPGAQSVVWDGTTGGKLLPAGSYLVVVIVRGAAGETRHETALTIAH
jgi:flagellar hook assembly protein FlgD